MNRRDRQKLWLVLRLIVMKLLVKMVKLTQFLTLKIQRRLKVRVDLQRMRKA